MDAICRFVVTNVPVRQPHWVAAMIVRGEISTRDVRKILGVAQQRHFGKETFKPALFLTISPTQETGKRFIGWA